MRPLLRISLILAVALSCDRYLERSIESPVMSEGVVSFNYMSRSSATVQVAGDWNNWGAGDAEQGEVLVGLMEKDKKGVWNLKIELAPGRYRYYFLINENRRVLDPANPRITEDPWGGKANLLIVP